MPRICHTRLPLRSAATWFAVFVCSGLLGVLAIHSGDSAWLAASAVFVVGVGSALSNAKRRGPLAWSVLIPAYYVVYFVALPVFQHLGGVAGPSAHPAFRPTLWWVAAGLIAFQIPAFVVTRSVAKHPRATLTGSGVWAGVLDTRTVLVLAMAGVSSTLYSFFFGYYGLAAEFANRGTLSGAASIGTTLLHLALALAWLRYFAWERRRSLAAGVLILLVALIPAVFSNSKGALVFPLMTAGVAYFLVRERVPKLAVVITVLVYALVAFPFVTAWRSAGVTQYRSGWERISEGLSMLTSDEWAIGETFDGRLQQSFGRGVADVFSRIVDQTGVAVPYEGGKSYLEALQFLVPRALWPDKPDNATGNRIGKRYGVVFIHDDLTNVAPTAMGEMYMNFGGLGVVLGMVLLGALASYIDCVLVQNIGRWFHAWTFRTAYLGQEQTVGQALVPLLLAFLLFAAVLHVITWKAAREGVPLRLRAAGSGR